MFDKRTAVNRFLSKERFYSHNAVSGTLKQALVDDIEKITVTNEFSPTALHIEPGKEFHEILVLHVLLKNGQINQKLLDALDRAIQIGYVLFILEYGDEYCASISHKTKTTGGKGVAIDRRWTTNWGDAPDFDTEGLSIDAIYAKLIDQVSGGRVHSDKAGLTDAIEKDIKIANLEKQLTTLRQKADREDQLNKKIALRNKVREIENKIKEVKDA